MDNNCGMWGDNKSPGLSSRNQYFVGYGYNVTYTVMYQGNERGQWSYPSPNSFPLSVTFTCDLSNSCGTDTSDYTQTTYLDSGRGYSGISESLYTRHRGGRTVHRSVVLRAEQAGCARSSITISSRQRPRARTLRPDHAARRGRRRSRRRRQPARRPRPCRGDRAPRRSPRRHRS